MKFIAKYGVNYIVDCLRKYGLLCKANFLKQLMASVIHAFGTTDHDQSVWTGRWQMLLYHLFADTSLAKIPAWLGSSRERVPDLELVSVLGRQLIDLLSQQNVLFGIVGEDH